MKKMKHILGLMFLVLAAIPAFAQQDEEPDEKRKEKIETLKRAYISEKLDLTVAEAEKFWPIYNEFDKKKDEVRKAIRTTYKKLKDTTPTEKELTESIDVITSKRKEEADLDAKFLKDCLPVLGTEKVLKLATLEKEFQRQLMQKLKEKRQEKMEGGGPHKGGGKKKG